MNSTSWVPTFEPCSATQASMPILKFCPNNAYGPDMVPMTPTLMTSAEAVPVTKQTMANTEAMEALLFIAVVPLHSGVGKVHSINVPQTCGWQLRTSQNIRAAP